MIKQKWIPIIVFSFWTLSLILPRFNCMPIYTTKSSPVNVHQNSLVLNFQLDMCISLKKIRALCSTYAISVEELAVVPHYYQFLCNDIYYCILRQVSLPEAARLLFSY